LGDLAPEDTTTMNRPRSASLAIPALLGLLLAASGASAPRAADPAKRIEFSGFLGDYDQLRRADAFSEFVWGYTKRPLVLREYDRAIVDPVLVSFHSEARGVAIDPQRLAELTTFFRDAVIEELEKVRAVELVDEPGSGVMRLRLAITDIDVARGAANVGAKVVGAATAGVGFLVPNVDVGGATMECEVLDAETGERLVAVVDTDRGRRMFNFKGMTAMGDAKSALRGWAKDFRRNLERIHEGKLPKGLEKAREARAKEAGKQR
jgi:hypothetical protein